LFRPDGFHEPGDERDPILEFALVNDEGPPSHRFVGGERLYVARPVTGDLGAPIGGVGLRSARPARAIVAMPETAVNENRELAGNVNDIRLARQIAAMKPVAGRDRAQKRADRKFRTGVARLDGAHDRGAVVGHSIAHGDAPRSNLAAVSFNLDRKAKQLSMVLLEPLEVRLDRPSDFPRILDREKMADDLTVMFSLAR
jgi:hypothetical protein